MAKLLQSSKYRIGFKFPRNYEIRTPSRMINRSFTSLPHNHGSVYMVLMQYGQISRCGGQG